MRLNLAYYEAAGRVSSWAARNPGATWIPPHVQRDLDLINRYDKARQFDADTVEQGDLQTFMDEVRDGLNEREHRKLIEHQIADYLTDVADATGRDDLRVVANQMSACRMSGTVGIVPGGGHVIAWDHKCGHVRLCPDESREETQRIAEFYQGPIVAFAKENPFHRIFYCVLTLPNYPAGGLAAGKREIFERYKALMKDEACDNVRGSLVIQEDPLSKGEQWNIHLNAILLVSGRFDFKALREAWGYNLEISQVDPDQVMSAILELVKYSAQAVTAKSMDGEKTAKGAPGLTDWPHDLFLEWYDAQKGFRRTRSYGGLYKIYSRKWNALSDKERAQVLELAELPNQHWRRIRRYCRRCWDELFGDVANARERERLKAKVRDALVHGERLDLDQVQWCGAVKHDEGGYTVDLIPGDNFPRRGELYCRKDNYAATGPPG